MATERDFGLAPEVRADARVLVLGSLPGRASLRAAQYYAHPGNHFWRLMAGVIGHVELPALTYRDRLDALQAARIGLWDTVDSAVRPGSLDADMRAVSATALAGFVATLPDLRAVAFNGAASARIGRRQLSESGLTLIDLPSSSAAHAAMPFAAKLERWMALAPFLR